MPNHPTLASLAADLDTGRTTARKLVEDCLARIADPAGEGARTFIHVDKDAAFAALEKGFVRRVVVDVNIDPRFDNLHSDPRFADLLRRIGLPEVQFPTSLS